MRKYIIFIITISILLNSGVVFAEKDIPIGAPNTIDEAQWLGQRIMNDIPGAFKTAWREGVYIFAKAWGWIFGVLKSIGNSLLSILDKEVERKRPEVEEEFNKEIEEMKEDIPKTTRSLWERFKDLVY